MELRVGGHLHTSMYNGIEGETGHMHALGGDALPRWLEVQCMMHARSRAATREASTDRSMHTRGHTARPCSRAATPLRNPAEHAVLLFRIDTCTLSSSSQHSCSPGTPESLLVIFFRCLRGSQLGSLSIILRSVESTGDQHPCLRTAQPSLSPVCCVRL